MNSFNVAAIREQFPILKQSVRGKALVYLDNAASTQKPLAVIQSLTQTYSECYANVHRGVHYLSEQATLKFDAVRAKIQNLIHARYPEEIIYVKGTTEAINLVAYSYGEQFLKAGDEIVVSALEHHANFVPWQVVAKKTGAQLKILPVDENGNLDLTQAEKIITPKTKLVAITHMANAIGALTPLKKIIAWAHAVNAVVVVDGAQAIVHETVDVQALDCDFYAFSAHKMYGPGSVGALYGKRELLEKMPPYQTGGDMILSVSLEETRYNVLPHKFEAGTPNIADVVAWGAAIDYLNTLPAAEIAAHEALLLNKLLSELKNIPGLRIFTPHEQRAMVSFMHPKVHAHDIGTILDSEGVAVRTGHHCAQPLLTFLKAPATTRVSLGMYNTLAEIDSFIRAFHKIAEIFKL